MKINVDTVIKDINDNPLKEPVFDDEGRQKVGEFKDVTAKDLLLRTVTNEEPGEREPKFTPAGQPNPAHVDVNPADKTKRFAIAVNMVKGGEVELTLDEIAILKSLVGKFYLNPLVVGRLYQVLEGIVS